MRRLRILAGDDALVVMGTALDYSLVDHIRVTVIATGVGNPPADNAVRLRPQLRATDTPAPPPLRSVSNPQSAPLREAVRQPAWLRRPQPVPTA
jgi:cell division GTPase FtsZ